MTRMRARWVVGTPLLLGALALSCGSGGVDGLFTQPSSNGAAGAVSAGASNHAGATYESGGAGGLVNVSGGAGTSSGAGASQGGANSHAGEGGQPAANGGSTSSGGGAAGSHAGAGGSHAGAGGSHAGAGGSHAGAGGSHAGAGGSHASAGGSNAGGTSAGGAPGGGAGGAGGGGAGGSTAGAGGGAGAACVDNDACLNTEYCAKPSCAAKAEGHCTPSPTNCGNTKLAIVCGCDGVTYHDACLLHQARQSSSALDTGACSKNANSTVTCADGDAQTCTGLGGVCGFKAENACSAVGPGNTGICWVLPASCPGSDDKTAQVCLAETTSCTSECDAIKNGQRYALPDHCN